MKEKFYTLLALMLAATGAQAQTITEEYQTYDDDEKAIYRHVVNYNAAKERASETIYKKERQSDGTWSAEKRVDRGVYTYEYDSRGRLAMKELKYENEELDSYRIYVTYNDDETIYTRYTLSYDHESFSRIWGVYSTGEQSLASVNRHDSYDRYYARYDRQGNVIEKGSINDDYDDNSDLLWPDFYYDYISPLESKVVQRRGGIKTTVTKYYRYADNGHLLEYFEFEKGYDDDGRRIVFTYDDFGRILTKTVYDIDWLVDDENEMVDILPDTGHKALAMASGEDGDEEEYRWLVSEKEEYTYATDEVYDITSGWYNEFGFCGPIASFKTTSYDYYDDEVETEESCLIAKRDASGKLLAFELKMDYADALPVITIDENGHIVKVVNNSEYYFYYDENGNYVDKPIYVGYDKSETNYTWQGENLVRVDEQAEYYDKMWMEKPETYSSSHTYSYGKGRIEMKNTYDSFIVENDGNRIRRIEKGSAHEDISLVEKQTEDVRFALWRPYEESRELGLDSIRVLSRKGRVVHVCNYSRSESDEIFLAAGNVESGYMLQPNLAADDYFHIERQGNLAYCYDIEDRLRYIVDGERLLKEFDYNEEVSSEVVGPAGKSFSTSPSGSCTVIEYLYDSNGNLTGVTTSKRDERGNITDSYTLTYIYDPASGIQGISTAPGFQLNGRSLGASDDLCFSLYDMDGRTIATAVNNFTFAQPGVYVMKMGERAIKIYVK